jgi:hypothetical protein
MADYNKFLTRKKVYLPLYPNAVALTLNQNLRGATTTTAIFQSNGSSPANFDLIGSSYVRGVKLTTNGQTISLDWRLPDDFYGGDDTHFWLVWSKEASTTTCSVGYDMLYGINTIIDWNGSGTADALAVAATAMDTDLDEVASFTDAKNGTRRALVRSMRGTINGGKLTSNDLLTLLIRLDQAPVDGGIIHAVAVEVDYAIRMRDSEIETM